MVWASPGIAVPAGPIAAILPSATITVPALISGPVTGCKFAPTSAKMPFGCAAISMIRLRSDSAAAGIAT